jgi:hypothetical protein
MHSLGTFLELLSEISDPRRNEGKLYKLQYVLLFSILAIVTGADSYRGIHTFMESYLGRLNEAFGLSWKRAPAYTTIRYIIRKLSPDSVEQVFRKHAEALESSHAQPEEPNLGQAATTVSVVAVDGKVLRHSFDNFNDRNATQVLSAFSTLTSLILAHIEIAEKSNEIPAAQKLLSELQLKRRILTLDAMHCQKKHFKQPSMLIFT